MQRALAMWKLIGAEISVLKVLEHGYKLIAPPPLTRSPRWFTVSSEKHPFLQKEIDGLLAKDAIERVHKISSMGFYSHILLVPKKNGKLRPVIDLSPLNKFLAIPKFKMLTS